MPPKTPTEETKPRYFVDSRVGCIAVRDREKTDPDYPGLHQDTDGVVWYRRGHRSGEGGWIVSPAHIDAAQVECARLNVLNPEKPTERTPEQLAEEYATTFHVNQSDRIKAFLAGHSAATQSAKETIGRLTMALAETEALELQHGAVIDRLTRERDEARGNAAMVVGGELVQSTGLDAVHRYKLIVQDLTPDIWKEFQAEESTVSWRCLALNSVSKIKHERDALQSDLTKAREERDEARITRNNIGAKWQQIATVAELERDEARKEIARLKGVLAEWSGKVHGPNGPWDMLHKATAEATTLRAELSAAREDLRQADEGRCKNSELYERAFADLKAANARAEEAIGFRAMFDVVEAERDKQNDRAEKAEKERDDALVFATRRKQERDAAKARAVNPDISLADYLINVRAIVDERDDLRRQLTAATNLNLRLDQERDAMRMRLVEEKEKHRQEVQSYERIVLRAKAEDHRAHVSALADLEKCKAGSQVVVAQYTKVIARLETRNSESLAALEATRERVQKYLNGAPLEYLQAALSLSPSTTLRDLKLKIAESAWKEGFCPSKTAIPQEQIDAAWLASETKAQILGERTGEKEGA